MHLMCCYGLKVTQVISVGESRPARCCRRAPRHKVVTLTQEVSILPSWVQFCLWVWLHHLCRAGPGRGWSPSSHLSECWRCTTQWHEPASVMASYASWRSVSSCSCVWAEFCLSHLSLLVSFTYYWTKKYLGVPFVGKLICMLIWLHSIAFSSSV